jgi:hypothetical protein
MITAIRYDASRRDAWNAFIGASKNGTFLFHRGYMEYHSDRFDDGSLMFFDDQTLVAVMPASVCGSEIVSHAGLTYGGVVSGRRMRTATMLEVFDASIAHLRSEGFRKLTYKRLPYIYHDIPSDEDLYALFRHNASLIRCDVAAAVLMGDRVAYTKGRKWAVAKSRKAALTVGRSDDFEAFMKMESEHLQSKYGTQPVHTAAEMRLLASRFPENIRLFTANAEDRLIAGILVYESKNVAHAQYIATTEEGKEVCALDAIIDLLLSGEYVSKRYFDFGISTEQSGRHLNAGLAENKESYGARAVSYDFYELNLA